MYAWPGTKDIPTKVCDTYCLQLVGCLLLLFKQYRPTPLAVLSTSELPHTWCLRYPWTGAWEGEGCSMLTAVGSCTLVAACNDGMMISQRGMMV